MNIITVTPEIIAQMRAHHAADEIRAGYYWQNGKGCFIGCIVHGDNVEAVERLTGLDLITTRIAERIFENVSDRRLSYGRDFFREMTDCLERNRDKDISLVPWQLLHLMVDRTLSLQSSATVRDACQPALKVLADKAKGLPVDRDSAFAAARSASLAYLGDFAAAANAVYAADFAAAAADAVYTVDAYAAYHVAPAARAIDVADYFAIDVADYVAIDVAELKQQAKTLIELIDAAPIVERI